MDTNGQGSSKVGSLPTSAPISEPVLPYFLLARIRRVWLAVLVFAVAFFALGLLADWALIHARGISQIQAAAIIDGFFAIVVAALVYRVLCHDRERRLKVVERLETINEMNHHIRNALQVISFNVHKESNEFELAEIKRAMYRIQWALREILPKVEPEFSSFEGSARDQAEQSQPEALAAPLPGITIPIRPGVLPCTRRAPTLAPALPCPSRSSPLACRLQAPATRP